MSKIDFKGMKKDLVVALSVTLIVFMIGGYFVLRKTGKLSTKADVNGPSFTLEPNSGSIYLDANLEVSVRMDTFGQAASGAQIEKIHFDPTVLQVIDADSQTDGVQIAKGNISNFEIPLANLVDNSAGTVSYSVSSFTNNFTGSDILAVINFKTIAESSSTEIKFDFDGTASTTMMTDVQGSNILAGVGSAAFSITTQNPAPTVDLKANNSDGPITINSGEAATLSWISANATSCSASEGWSGSKELSGSDSTGALTVSQSYILTCTGDGGSVSDAVTVNVKTPDKKIPQIDLKANNMSGSVTIDSGLTVKLGWTVTNASSCNAGGDWQGAKGLIGEETTAVITTAKTYTLICQGDVESTGSVTVNVNSVNSGGDDTSDDVSDDTNRDSTGGTSKKTASTPVAALPSKLTPAAPVQLSKLPSNIQPIATPQVSANNVELYKNDSMKPWALWFLYAIIPAFLAGGAIYFYLKRNKTMKNNEVI
ncbi:MAG: Glucan endo-1,3-beta-glucanase, putative, glu81A [Berkelbacteria bacterium GW2011_GWE1_39_12]|uniref:Glucan endo-1,3-beta-glucanase, putative, glu81A n=1 Tax=Berkelbacteria bacterium GW2011_GWE1_39_12 TaxID=1618337 RepID=A0A0G4B4R2_9BACT|nr:MAG: Glucan endo-1,3-beta-glucanase, putative, glu81A [Berkelbacteria bacterium GW2011_GWE1_39_12]